MFKFLAKILIFDSSAPANNKLKLLIFRIFGRVEILGPKTNVFDHCKPANQEVVQKSQLFAVFKFLVKILIFDCSVLGTIKSLKVSKSF